MADEPKNSRPRGFDFDQKQLAPYYLKPPPFTPGEPLFWDDPHISAQMLEAHLNPETDQASRNRGTIEASVAWIVEALGVGVGDAVLDLGCGPGLYAARGSFCAGCYNSGSSCEIWIE